MFSDFIEDLVGLSDDDLDASLRDLELQRRTNLAHMACAIAIADARQLNAVDGHRTMKGYLRATCSWSNHETAKMRSLARLIDTHPDVGNALLAGHIGGPQAFELAKVHGNPRVTDQLGPFLPVLLHTAETLSYEDFCVAVQHFVLRADPDGAHRDVDMSIENRDARMVAIEGAIDFCMTGGDPLITAELLAIFNEFLDAAFEKDVAARRAEFGDDAEFHELPRTTKQRRHDATIAIFRAAHTAVIDGKVSDPLVNIVVDADTFARVMTNAGLSTDTNLNGDDVDPFTGLADNNDLLDQLADDITEDELVVAGPSVDSLAGSDLDPHPADAVKPTTFTRCETTSGVALHPHHVLRAALAGHIRRIVVDSDGVVIDQGRKQRLFAGSARQAAMLLVRHCEHPGCDLPTDWCQVDHAHEWTDGGATDQANARARCGGHNRVKHRKKLRSKRATGGHTYTIRPDGTIMLPVGARTPIFPDDDDSDVEANDPADVVRLTNLARSRLADLARPA